MGGRTVAVILKKNKIISPGDIFNYRLLKKILLSCGVSEVSWFLCHFKDKIFLNKQNNKSICVFVYYILKKYYLQVEGGEVAQLLFLRN